MKPLKIELLHLGIVIWGGVEAFIPSFNRNLDRAHPQATLRLFARSSSILGNVKEELLVRLSETPRNAVTPSGLTEVILGQICELEESCPTADSAVLPSLSGNWELLWTTQDRASREWQQQNPFTRWVNPLENQAYSNNPSAGRLSPVLPRGIQDRLEALGLIKDAGLVKSSQSIDLQRNRVRNVVGFSIPSLRGTRRASLTVDISFKAHAEDKRRIEVAFKTCRVAVSKSSFDITLPLGIVGPTGWLRTTYIDDTIRITRGHKGSVFVLSRASAQII